nr:unnamed protein product [Digitaria exilis]
MSSPYGSWIRSNNGPMARLPSATPAFATTSSAPWLRQWISGMPELVLAVAMRPASRKKQADLEGRDHGGEVAGRWRRLGVDAEHGDLNDPCDAVEVGHVDDARHDGGV